MCAYMCVFSFFFAYTLSMPCVCVCMFFFVFKILIAGLGLCTMFRESCADSIIETPEFMAHELFEEKYGTGVDV